MADMEYEPDSYVEESKARLLAHPFVVRFIQLIPDRSISWVKFFSKCSLDQSGYRYGSLLRSGLEVRSVNTYASGTPVVTLGVFSTQLIPQNAYITNFGGIIRHWSELETEADISHTIDIPNTGHAEYGKCYASWFHRPTKAGLQSRPHTLPHITLHPKHYSIHYQKRGIGFMINRAHNSRTNCAVRFVYPSSDLKARGYFPYPIFYATMDILPNTELRTCYYNTYPAARRTNRQIRAIFTTISN